MSPGSAKTLAFEPGDLSQETVRLRDQIRVQKDKFEHVQGAEEPLAGSLELGVLLC